MPVFNNQIELKEGVYTSIPEVLINNPKYFDCRFETKVGFWFGNTSIYYYDLSGTRHEFNDTILFVVEDGNQYVKYGNHFCKLILTGAISTFYIENTIIYTNHYANTQTDLYYWDIETGTMGRVNVSNMDEILKRDSSINAVYSGISNSLKRKTLYSYILKYNAHNPIYINTQ
jgi:hypothetical protein